jgi:hypothetical protein
MLEEAVGKVQPEPPIVLGACSYGVDLSLRKRSKAVVTVVISFSTVSYRSLSNIGFTGGLGRPRIATGLIVSNAWEDIVQSRISMQPTGFRGTAKAKLRAFSSLKVP